MSAWIMMLGFAVVQNVSLTMVSRAKNRNHMGYHAACSVLANIIWFLTMRMMVVEGLSLYLLLPYTIGTVAGSLWGATISMKIEKIIGAET